VRVPAHLALIPDGNRRWARKRGLTPSDGHRAGILVVGTIAEAAWAAGVEVVSFWWGSPANLTSRSPEEVEIITECLRDWLAGPGASMLHREGAAFDVIGRWEELCPQIASGIEAARRAAGGGPRPRQLVLLIAYDGRDEIRAAAQRLQGGGASEAEFGRATWTGALPPVDLLLRTGGDAHLSAGFLQWSTADAQLAFPNELWPDFTPSALAEVLVAYGRTERRFGA
jgi:undecaprenyl diphosphate synthase